MGNVCEYSDENRAESFKFSRKNRNNMRGNLSDASLSRLSMYNNDYETKKHSNIEGLKNSLNFQLAQAKRKSLKPQ